MPSIMVNGKLATVDGVQVPVTTGSIADVVRYLSDKGKAEAKSEAKAEVKAEAKEEPKAEVKTEAKAEVKK